MEELQGINWIMKPIDITLLDMNIPRLLYYTGKYINHIIYTNHIMHGLTSTINTHVSLLHVRVIP